MEQMELEPQPTGRKVLVTCFGMVKKPGYVVHTEDSAGWSLVRIEGYIYSIDATEMEDV